MLKRSFSATSRSSFFLRKRNVALDRDVVRDISVRIGDRRDAHLSLSRESAILPPIDELPPAKHGPPETVSPTFSL